MEEFVIELYQEVRRIIGSMKGKPGLFFRWSVQTVSLNRNEKQIVIDEISAQLSEAQSIVVAEYRGIDVASVTVLRKKARESGVYLRVLKNTLVTRAIKETNFQQLEDKLVGPLIYAISKDPVAAAKVLSSFAKENDKIVLKAGALPGSVLDSNGIKQLATMPSREELLSKLMGTMQAPIAKFVRTLNEVPTKFVRGLAAVRDQKEAA
ncbi:50S ribosomal protein L10 [Taylorella equigenitalis 14/56]|uniref:Large ribosomal subunit protein uL10 n=3 Tax=Taylorella equigenitalis TaxID=29575 RepID=A0A654KGN7_TAYEM|nr:LSU ribosomal protein L10p (P0) [Taylorella equigenitalis MCE9]AFN36633.1 50S ribosomal protein L10 [Taylorella equigenitalis ATCC 35865]CCG18220.1 50S ribosomal protein L10 [Taylorella equigenitalis 14/56]VEG32854.1 50S ribosomal protein L8 [Taylorella equigenitalis ATCC 35865]